MPTDSDDPPGSESSTRWVVGTDGSEHAYSALRWASQQARDRNVTIELVTAWQYPYTGLFPLTGEATGAVDANQGPMIEAELSATAARAIAEFGAHIETSSAVGPAGHVLLDASEHAELLVVGSRGRGGFARLLLGSVSHQVANHAECPTVIVPSQSKSDSLSLAVVGVDGSTNSIAALRWAHRFVPESCELVALSTWEPPFDNEGRLDFSTLAQLRDSAEHQVERSILDFEKELGCEARVARVFEVGRAGECLAQHGANADLLVIGARGRSGLAAALMGSTTTWVAHHPPCPTVIVPDQPAPVTERS